MNNDKEHQFELLVRQHKRTIYTVCYMFSRNKAEIDDLFQEILIRLWNGFDTYEADNPIPMIVYLTPEASQLWYEFTTKAKGHRVALYLDGVMIQDWQIQNGIDNGTFFIMKEWASREEMEAFCERLIRQ